MKNVCPIASGAESANVFFFWSGQLFGQSWFWGSRDIALESAYNIGIFRMGSRHYEPRNSAMDGKANYVYDLAVRRKWWMNNWTRESKKERKKVKVESVTKWVREFMNSWERNIKREWEWEWWTIKFYEVEWKRKFCQRRYKIYMTLSTFLFVLCLLLGGNMVGDNVTG